MTAEAGKQICGKGRERGKVFGSLNSWSKKKKGLQRCPGVKTHGKGDRNEVEKGEKSVRRELKKEEKMGGEREREAGEAKKSGLLLSCIRKGDPFFSTGGGRGMRHVS